MKWLGLALAVAGCNPIFGLDRTKIWDAAVPADAGPDAPPIDARTPAVCPGVGVAPAFSNTFNQLPTPGCFRYFVSRDGRGIAACRDPNYTTSIAIGEQDQSVQRQTLEGLPQLSYTYDASASPEGDRLYITGATYTNNTWRVLTYELAPVETRWVVSTSYDLPMLAGMNPYSYTHSNPSAGPARRMVMAGYDSTDGYKLKLYEVGHTGSAWEFARKQPLPIDGTQQTFDTPSLTSDGLHMVFTSYVYQMSTDAGVTPARRSVYYATRSAIDEDFGEAVRVTTVPDEVTAPFITDDCARLYFAALNTIFYLPY